MVLNIGFRKPGSLASGREEEKEKQPDLQGAYPYLEKQVKENKDKLEDASKKMEEIQKHVYEIKQEKDLLDFIMENPNVSVNAAWIIDRIQQIKNDPDYNADLLESELMDFIIRKKIK